MQKPKNKSSKATTGHIVGRARFAKISAVEGIALSPAMVKRARAAAAKGLSAEETRKMIIRSYRKD